MLRAFPPEEFKHFTLREKHDIDYNNQHTLSSQLQEDISWPKATPPSMFLNVLGGPR
jgi:hypothetical protein